ncbi:MAG TPA: glycosyltransferase family 9 protein, partial [Gammaproteobacteria bacterium]
MNSNVLENVRKIAVLRANALGDYIFSLPALVALKSAYPQAELVYMGNRWHREFLSGRPGPVDRVIVVPEDREARGELDGIPSRIATAFFAAMRAESFDLALQMHGGGRASNPFIRELGARTTIGLRADGAVPLDRNIPYSLFHNEVLRYLEVARLAGAPPVTVEPEIVVTDGDYRKLHAACPDLRRPYAVLHPGASDERRRWPAAKMAAVAQTLAARNIHVYV